MILVDTSVWIDHLRRSDAVLASLLLRQQVLTHNAVIGELALGSLANRSVFLNELGRLPRAVEARHDEVLHLIDSERLHGAGIGYIDAHLCASALISGFKLWTRDKRLLSVAQTLGTSRHHCRQRS